MESNSIGVEFRLEKKLKIIKKEIFGSIKEKAVRGTFLGKLS